MRVKFTKKVSNKYGIIQQVYDDKVVIRTNNIIYKKYYNAYMFILNNNSCLWIKDWKVAETRIGKDGWNTVDTFLIEVTPENFKYLKTYDTNFEGFCFKKEEEINSYEDLVELAKKQESEELACC